jgi:hypothetical protein
MKLKILVIDPSGTGTTGIIFIVLDENNVIDLIRFYDSKSNEWKEHYWNLFSLIENLEPNIILYEDTNYIYGRQQKGTVGLCKLIGSIHGMKDTFDFIDEIGSVLVGVVKSFRSKVQSGVENIDGLTYQEGRGHGWKYKGERINLHLVDALVVYHLWSKKHLKSKDEIKAEIDELKSKKRLGSKQKEKLLELESKIKLYAK